MKNVKLKRLSLLNFKGVRRFDSEFGDENLIYGQNASGKSTLMDAFLWLCFRKDAQGRTDHEIKTLDAHNQPIHRLEHEVTGEFMVNNQPVELKRVYREKWVKKKGNKTEDFTGHEVEHFWNGVPLSETEYKAKVSELFDESVFRLVTNVGYFNSLDWQKRREVLVELAGEVSDEDVLNEIQNDDNAHLVAWLAEALNQKKTVDQFSKEIAVKKKRIKDELILLPARIDEAKRNLPDLSKLPEVESEIQTFKADLQLIENQLTNISEAAKAEQQKKVNLIREQGSVGTLLRALEDKEREKYRDEVNDLKIKVQNTSHVLESQKEKVRQISKDLEYARREAETAEQRRAMAINEWKAINARKLEFKEDEFSCPTCRREYETWDIDAKKKELIENFNEAKSKDLAANVAKGKEIAEMIKTASGKVSGLEAKLDAAKSEVSNLESEYKKSKKNYDNFVSAGTEAMTVFKGSNAEYVSLKERFNQLQIEIDKDPTEQDNSSLLVLKKELQDKIDVLYKEMPSRDTHKQMEQRIAVLEVQEGELNEELANLEHLDFVIQSFTKQKMDEVERRVNDKFELVKFKMFDLQINGGLKETCVTLINGVPYSAANTAAQVQAGLDIINTLSNHFGITGPVWIDNRESVTDLPATDCQLISLIVSPQDKELRFESSHKAMEVVA